MIKRWITGTIVLLLVATQAYAQFAYVEGSDYLAISPAVKTSDPDKVVVTEVFWYGCPHCFRFEPAVQRWAAALPEGVVFEQMPSALNPRWTEHARAYYAFKYMNVLDQVHKAFFDAIHIERKRLNSVDTIAEFVADQGLDEKVFRDTYFSFPVETQIRKNIQIEKRYGIKGVPAVVVNGKYLVTASLAGSNQRMIEIIDFLVAREMAQ